MLLLSRSGVRELILTNSNRRCKLPSYVFSCLELTKLELKHCLFKPPLKFKGFLNLEDLSLEHINFEVNLGGTQIILPHLKNLSLVMCTKVYNFNIKATKLFNLTITAACPDAMLLRLLHSPCLTLVSIYFGKPIIEGKRQVETITSAMMLSNLTKVEGFLIAGHFLKIITAENTPKWLARPFNSLNRLHFHEFQLGNLDQLHGALCLLRNSPNLKELHVMHLKMEPQVDVGPASNHLESPNCLDCTLDQLQTVEITYLERSKPELLFIKLLLAHSPSLDKLTITPSGALDAEKILDIAKDVMWFPRASPKAKILYLNLET
ncbi:unnamed protein product [Lactuca virosa]|uniref:FBD domain-containing protein n=1 Tax=Lactuca virosa TaxID=75947 RepID=A0AAU9NTM7_9ASTR|nr:unnamed protein product [Lactuca virosa]